MFNMKQYYICLINKLLNTFSADLVEAVYTALRNMNERRVRCNELQERDYQADSSNKRRKNIKIHL